MRGVSRWASRVAPLVAVFLVFAAAARAEESTTPLADPPQARISPPGGLTAEPSWFEAILIWLQTLDV